MIRTVNSLPLQLVVIISRNDDKGEAGRPRGLFSRKDIQALKEKQLSKEKKEQSPSNGKHKFISLVGVIQPSFIAFSEMMPVTSAEVFESLDKCCTHKDHGDLNVLYLKGTVV